MDELELLSINQYTADGTTTTWNISFAGGYISREHVKVFVFDDGEFDNGVIPEFEFISDYVISITPAVAAGKVIRIYRDTPYEAPLVNFSDGSVINEETLDLNANQAVFLSAELRDRFGSATDLANIAAAAGEAVRDAQAAAEEAEDRRDETAAIKVAAATELTGIKDAAVVDLSAIKATTLGYRDQTEVLKNEAIIATGYRVNYARDTKANLDLISGTVVGQSAAVYADATLALRGVYSWSGTIWVRVADLPEVTVAAAAAELSAAIASLYVPSYTHPYGSLDRTAISGLTISTGLTISGGGGTINNLIDGGLANTSAADGVAFSTQAVAGLVIAEIRYPLKRSLILNELRWRNGSATAYTATAQVQLLTHDGVWVNFGAVTALGGATSVVIPISNTLGHAGVRLIGVAGSMSGSVWCVEVELKLANGPQDGMARMPVSAGLPGDRVEVGDYPLTQNVFAPRYGTIPVHPGVSRLGLYMMDDPAEGTKIRNYLSDAHHFDWSGGLFGASPVKTRKGWLFQRSMVRTPATITGMQVWSVVYRTRAGATTRYEMSTSIAGEYMFLAGNGWRSGLNGSTVTAIAPNGELLPMPDDTPGAAGTSRPSADWLNRGNWVMAFVEAYTPLGALRVALGGDPDLTANDTLYADEFEVAYLSLFGAPLSTARKKAEADWILPLLANRGIHIRNQENTRGMVDLLPTFGDSNTGGDERIDVLPKQLKEMLSFPNILIQTCNSKSKPYARRPAPYDAGSTAWMNLWDSSPGSGQDGRKFGIDLQLCRRHTYGGHARQLVIVKAGADGSYLGGVADGGGGSLSWNADVAWNTGMIGHALTRLYEAMQWIIAQGYGFTIPAFVWGSFANDLNLAYPLAFSTNWAANFQTTFAKLRLLTANMIPALHIMQRPRTWEVGVTSTDATRTSSVQAQFDAYIAGDPTNRKAISLEGSAVDEWGQTIGYRLEANGAKLHLNGALNYRAGNDLYALVPWSTY